MSDGSQMSGEIDRPSKRDHLSWLKHLWDRDQREIILPPEKTKVNLDYYLKLCSNGIPPELETGGTLKVTLENIPAVPITLEGQPIRVDAQNCTLIQLLELKRREANENLEGILAAVITPPGNRTKGLPVVLEVLPQPCSFTIWSVQGTQVGNEQMATITEQELRSPHYQNLRLVVGKK